MKKLFVLKKLGQLFMSAALFVHVSAQADIDPSLIAGQLEKNIEAAFSAGTELANMATSNAAFKAFDVMPMLFQFLSPAMVTFEEVRGPILSMALNYIFNEHNIIDRKSNELTYSLNSEICELFDSGDADEGLDRMSFVYKLCQYAVGENNIKISAMSDDNLYYSIKINLGVQDDDAVELKSFVSSPNMLNGSLNLTGMYNFLRTFTEVNPELSGALNEYVQKLSGHIEGYFSFSTPERKAHCKDNAKACLSFNIAAPVNATLFDKSVNLSWDTSPQEQKTFSVFALENGSSRIDINSGSIDLGIPLYLLGLKHGRLKASITFNPSNEDGYSSAEKPKVIIDNLSLEKGINELSFDDKNIRLSEGLCIDKISYCETTKGIVCSVSFFKFIMDLVKQDALLNCAYEEILKLSIGDSDNHVSTFTFDPSNAERTGLRIPGSSNIFIIPSLSEGLVISKTPLNDSIGIVSGSIEAEYSYGLKVPGKDLIKLGNSRFLAEEGDHLATLR